MLQSYRWFCSGIISFIPVAVVLWIMVVITQPLSYQAGRTPKIIQVLISDSKVSYLPRSEKPPADYGALEMYAVALPAKRSRAFFPPSVGQMNFSAEQVHYRTGPANTERYEHFSTNPVLQTQNKPVSTFSVDVDTGAYSNIRRFLTNGLLPPSDAVRVEEMINYFKYGYQGPRSESPPFAVHTEVSQTPWNAKTHLLKIGIKGYELPLAARPAENLVFLLDVSGSMNRPNKLPLMIASMKLLAGQLREDDTVAIVVYAGASGVALETTSGKDTATIRAALSRLYPGGSTAGAAGIGLAYDMAEKAFIKGGINRVILATDGDFNVGVTDIYHLKSIIARNRAKGIALTTLGFGDGNYNEALMEQLADIGDGNYAYIDNFAEGRKVLVDQFGGTFYTIARDVKIQIEFNPAYVAEYRLIGYENRVLKAEDFANDRIDAGEIGAGHTVTALYEIALVGSGGTRHPESRYLAETVLKNYVAQSEFAHLRLRYKMPESNVSGLIETPLMAYELKNASMGSPDMQFAAAVAAFGQLLRANTYLEGFDYDDVANLAQNAANAADEPARREFITLVRLAKTLTPDGEQ